MTTDTSVGARCGALVDSSKGQYGAIQLNSTTHCGLLIRLRSGPKPAKQMNAYELDDVMAGDDWPPNGGCMVCGAGQWALATHKDGVRVLKCADGHIFDPRGFEHIRQVEGAVEVVELDHEAVPA